MIQVCKLALPLLCGVLTGCSAGDARLAVEGQVTLDGQPLENGSITFAPLDPKGRGTGTNISGGKFHLAASNGLRPGEYRVKAQAYRATGKKLFDPQLNQEIGEIREIPLKDGGERQVAIEVGGANALELQLQSLK